MSFLDKLISGFRSGREVPDLKFGRYTDGAKTDHQQNAWEAANVSFEQSEFLKSVEQFLIFLYDPKEDNVHWRSTENKINFTLHQGSQAIEGWASVSEFQAVVQLGRYDAEEAGLYQELLQNNYHLTYSKYCWADGIITCKFSSNSLDASPIKLYNGLRELSQETDKQDDLALAKYAGFHPMFSGKVSQLAPVILEAKIDFFNDQYHELKESYQHCGLDPNEYQGAYAYLLLNFCYKIDYLLSPEARLKETLETIHGEYYHGNAVMTSAKNQAIFEQISGFAENTKAHWQEEFYKVTNTFGHTASVSPERLRSFLREEVEKMDWYVQEGHREVALAIPGFIIGYCLFHYSLHDPLSSFFQLYYEVLESNYFDLIGYRPALSKDGKPQKAAIARILKESIRDQKENFPELDLPIDTIRYDSAFHFSKSYLLALCQMKW